MLADGASHLFVELTQNVEVEEKRAGNRVTYFLKHARVLHRNNENTLVTVFFNTPVDRARLLPTTGGLNFIVDLRTNVTPTWKMTPAKDNSAILEIVFPKGEYGGQKASAADESVSLGNDNDDNNMPYSTTQSGTTPATSGTGAPPPPTRGRRTRGGNGGNGGGPGPTP